MVSVDDGQKAQTGTKILFMSFHKYCGPGLVATAFQYGCTSPRHTDAKFKTSTGLSPQISAGNEVASNARRWTDFFRKGCEFDLVGTRLHCTGYLAAVVSSECATTKASTAAFKVVQGLSVSRSLLRQFSHIFIPRLHQAERLSDVKSPLLQPAVTQQLLVSSFLHIAEDKERSKDQGKKTDIGFAVGFLCTAWLFAGCVNV